MEKELTIQHNNKKEKKILFFISLPQNIMNQMSEKDFSYSDAIERIRRINDVVLHETINREFFVNACDYRLIIVVGHYDKANDSLVIADGSLFPMKAIPESINESFDGIIDLSSCRSSHIKESIKQKCRNCHILSTNNSTGVELRLHLYPKLLDFIFKHPDINYHDAYQRILREEYEKQLRHKLYPTTETTNLGTDLPDTPESLEHRFSTFAPACAHVDKSYTVQVHLNLNTETGKAEVEVEAHGIDPNTTYKTSKQCIGLNKEDIIDVSIFFPYGDKENPYAKHISVDSRTKPIECRLELTHIEFNIVISHAYPYDELNIRLLMRRRVTGKDFMDLNFNVPVLRYKLDERMFSLIEHFYGAKIREKIISDYQTKLDEWEKIENEDGTGITILSKIKEEFVRITKKGEFNHEEERKIQLCRLLILEKRLEMLIAYKKTRNLIKCIPMKKVDRQIEIREQATKFFTPLLEYAVDIEVYNILRLYLKKDNKDLGVIQNKVVGVGQTVGSSYATKTFCALLTKMADPTVKDLYYYSYTPGHAKKEKEDDSIQTTTNAIIVQMAPSIVSNMMGHKRQVPQIDPSHDRIRSSEESKRQAFTRDVLPYINKIFNDNSIPAMLRKYLDSDEGKTSVFAYYLLEAILFERTQ